jgi:hypothetical protein
MIATPTTIQDRHAILLQGNEGWQPAHGIVVRHRAAGAFHIHTRNQLQHIRGAARRLPLDLRRTDGRYVYGNSIDGEGAAIRRSFEVRMRCA